MADADVIVVGAGLAGLVAAAEAAEAGRRVLLLDQESEQSLGGQAWWPKKWARAYVEWAATEKRPWLSQLGHSVVPVIGWAERGGYDGAGPGNSVPRFHITWGTGPGVVEPFEKRVRAAAEAGRLEFGFRHRVDAMVTADGTVTGVSGAVLEPSDVPRGMPSSRSVVGEFERGGPSAADSARDAKEGRPAAEPGDPRPCCASPQVFAHGRSVVPSRGRRYRRLPTYVGYRTECTVITVQYYLG